MDEESSRKHVQIIDKNGYAQGEGSLKREPFGFANAVYDARKKLSARHHTKIISRGFYVLHRKLYL